jgi:hypothetical protein
MTPSIQDARLSLSHIRAHRVNPNAREVTVVDLVQARVPFRILSGPILAAAVVIFSAPPALRAQKSGDPSMPLPSGVHRDKAAEAAAGAGNGAGGRMVQIFKIGAPLELLVPWYLRQMSPYENSPLDTTHLQPGESTPMSYHITYHSWKDQCMDPAESASAGSDSTASDSTRPCKRWRRGIDKRRALSNSRVALDGGRWIDRFTITWFTREASGGMVRRQIEVRDAGLSDNWQHDNLKTQIILERTTMAAGQ